MAGQQLLKWFQQRPWLLLPLLGLIPLAGLALNQHSEQPTPQVSQTVPSPIASAPLPAPAKSPQPTLQPKASTSPKPSPATLVPVNPASFTKEQAAINERAKAAFAASTATVDSFIEMRVGIAIGVGSASIGSSIGADLTDEKGRSLHSLAAGTAYTAQAGSLGAWQTPALVWVEPAPGGVLYLGDKPYRGKFLLASQQGRIWVVNYINLRHYLASVVGSEVSPSWHINALKAQSVAARSYALTYYFRPVNALYQMGADEYYQVYSGISREADRTQQAVDATAGEFVSYRGGIVESLYAASDDIVAEAFQGKGMSQLGALNLAEHGYSYHQILANYYPKTGVARIEQDRE